MAKQCIWCCKKESQVTFVNPAHIFPQSLGGKRICTQVCDLCNSYFGSKQTGLPSVEIALKEPLNISRYFVLTQGPQTKKLARYKSEYFDYDLSKQLIKPKMKYSTVSHFQEIFTKQFKRGIYKIFLEERSQSKGDALDAQFDFIREFARYGLGDYPVYYCQPYIPAIFVSTDIHEPVIRFTDHSEEIMKQFGFYDYTFMTHNLAIPAIRTYELTEQNYLRYMLAQKSLYSKISRIRTMDDLDFMFNFAFSH